MTIAEPVWWGYVKYELCNGIPVMTRFMKGTPKKIKDAYYRDQEMFERAREEGIIL
ncbi:MAG: hypothetical protein J5673_05465 [Candidatus Methanomethylophilaceae archaeon]|nr:hypothetical protein [Candidatus Methanomethylophilaceae archaeon]